MCANEHVTGALCSVFFVAGNRVLWEDGSINLFRLSKGGNICRTIHSQPEVKL